MSSVTTTRASSTISRQPHVRRVRSTKARACAALSGTGASCTLACTRGFRGSISRELVFHPVDRLSDLVGCVACLLLHGAAHAVGTSFVLQRVVVREVANGLLRTALPFVELALG